MLTTVNNADEMHKWIVALESQGFNWKPVGGISNNSGTVEIGSDPGESLNERITNAIDAVLEREWREKHFSESQPASPREAVTRWFRIPGGKLSNLPQESRRKLAEMIQVILLESGQE